MAHSVSCGTGIDFIEPRLDISGRSDIERSSGQESIYDLHPPQVTMTTSLGISGVLIEKYF